MYDYVRLTIFIPVIFVSRATAVHALSNFVLLYVWDL